MPGGGGAGAGNTAMWGPTGWNRLFNTDVGAQASLLIPAALAASILLGVGLALDGADTTDGPAVEDVVAVAASSGLPSDPLSVTDQPAFLASVLAQEPAP